jgi:hypothetical protein
MAVATAAEEAGAAGAEGRRFIVPQGLRATIQGFAKYLISGEKNMAIERTLSIIKPDAVAKNVIGQIYARFEAAGL